MEELRDKLTKAQPQPLRSIEERQPSEIEELILKVCQVLFTIEELIIEKVLPRTMLNEYGEEKKVPIYRIREMEEALNSPVDGMLFHDEKEQTAARGEWEDLKTRLKWKKYDVNILQHLKRHRLNTAHP